MLTYEITTPEKQLEIGKAESISLPTPDGQITILSHHVPLVSVLGAGEIVIRTKDGESYFASEGGFVEVRPNNHVAILADFTVRAEDLDMDAIEKAHDRAKEQLRTQHFDDDEQFVLAAAQLERELAKMRVARKRVSR